MKYWKHPLAVLGIILGAATLIGAAVQSSGPQFASVDVQKVFYESNQGKAGNEEFERVKQQYNAVLEQWAGAPVLTREEFATVRQSLEANATPEVRTRATALLDTARTRAKRLQDLQAKQDRTPTDTADLNALVDQVTVTRDNLAQLSQELNARLQELGANSRKRIMDQIKATIADVAKRNNYAVVYEVDVVPYTANDITNTVLAEMNKK